MIRRKFPLIDWTKSLEQIENLGGGRRDDDKEWDGEGSLDRQRFGFITINFVRETYAVDELMIHENQSISLDVDRWDSGGCFLFTGHEMTYSKVGSNKVDSK